MQNINIHKLENVSILGLGKSALATIDFLLKKCPNLKGIRISDIKNRDDFDIGLISKLEAKLQGVCELEFEFGQQSYEFITAKQKAAEKHNSFIMISPGIPPRTKIIQDLFKSDFTIGTDFDLFTESIFLDEDDHVANYIGITGTNGKTTTTSLVAHILATKALGNIGNPMLDYYGLEKPYVLELSSFQLFYSRYFKAPHVAALLNISPDHLDWHTDLQDYADSKTKLFLKSREQISVINYDDEYLRNFSESLPKLRFFSTQENLKDKIKEVSTQHPNKVMAYAYIKNETLMLCEQNDHGYGAKDSSVSLEIPIIKTSELNIVGEHNYSNALAAILITHAAGVSIETIREKLVSFQPVEHRLEYVTEINSKKVYNDSKATNPDSAIKAIEAFDKCIAIVGGKDKNLDLSDYAQVLAQRAVKVIAIGEIKEKFKQELAKLNYSQIVLADDLDTAVKEALTTDAQLPVVFAPGSSSFDMFENFAIRGKIFKEITLKYAKSLAVA